MKTLSTAGTSLEVLAPYLPFQPTMRCIDPDYSGQGAQDGILMGLHSLNTNFPGQLVTQITTRYPGMYLQVPLGLVLPVLRPFSALCEPLADGTIPIVEAIRADRQSDPEFDWSAVEIDKDGEVSEIEVGLPYAGAGSMMEYDFIYPSWEGIGWRGADYLRSKHFAVGLEPHQFIEKVGAATPTKQEGNGHE